MHESSALTDILPPKPDVGANLFVYRLEGKDSDFHVVAIPEVKERRIKGAKRKSA